MAVLIFSSLINISQRNGNGILSQFQIDCEFLLSFSYAHLCNGYKAKKHPCLDSLGSMIAFIPNFNEIPVKKKHSNSYPS